MHAVIVDDEKRARETLRNMLELYHSSVKVVGEASDIRSAFEMIQKLKPDLVFLDVEMPNGSGFELLKQFLVIDFKIIFTTAYEEYAVNAFKFSALDYLLKPINPEELMNAVNKAQSQIEKEIFNIKLSAFINSLDDIKREIKKIVLKTSNTIHVVNVKEIIRCEADRNYTNFFLEGGKKIMVSVTLKEYDELLSPYGFFRAHQSHLVNISYIERYDKKDGGSLVMKDKSKVPVASRKKDDLLDLLEKI
jgi:two-component system, LytTR family, response regulator